MTLASSGTGSANPLPKTADVVVIGGGVAGVSTALFLALRGVSVVLCEKGRIAGEQSSRNWGWIRKMGRDHRELPLMIESARLWAKLASEMAEDIGYRKCGATYLARSPAELQRHSDWLERNAHFGLDSMLLTENETDRFLGRNDQQFLGALHTASDAVAEPALAVPALARHAGAQGVRIFEDCAVRTIEHSAGRVSGVATEHGLIASTNVVLAGGVWSRGFLENIGVSFPQLAIKSSVLRTAPATVPCTGAIGSERVSIRPRNDGGFTVARSGAAEFQLIPAAFHYLPQYLPMLRDRWQIMKIRAGRQFFGPLGTARWEADAISPFERVRVLDPSPDKALLADVMKSARSLFPQFSGVAPVESWAGMIDVVPDEIPAIGPVAGHDGLTVVTGLSGHGFGIGPGAGLLAAQMVTGESPIVDPDAFSPMRFSRKAAA
ncbi:NAD(P)/FAD-dependent oxidoreductase [Sedimentitalea todarodis]|uniref:FAD-binding oxidoreductase n=1 Tax=Sedimentitalea todarodis TaxID=1631240 RepID=A0ABU3VHE2_9RHOB|nr:FAD-binding oxidoreductase [Sedimentitalea todarodis]MDU9005589.1 FAD-binding oxidoreductase [Sedimentitalea todarodis]